MSRSASDYRFKEHVAGFRNELKVLDAFLAEIRRLSCRHRSWHVAHERDAPLFAGSSDCKIALSRQADRKSTRLNSSHLVISYAVFCLKKKKIPLTTEYT